MNAHHNWPLIRQKNQRVTREFGEKNCSAVKMSRLQTSFHLSANALIMRGPSETRLEERAGTRVIRWAWDVNISQVDKALVQHLIDLVNAGKILICLSVPLAAFWDFSRKHQQIFVANLGKKSEFFHQLHQASLWPKAAGSLKCGT